MLLFLTNDPALDSIVEVAALLLPSSKREQTATATAPVAVKFVQMHAGNLSSTGQAPNIAANKEQCVVACSIRQFLYSASKGGVIAPTCSLSRPARGIFP